MSDRTYVTMLIGAGAVIVVGLVWGVFAFTAPPRESAHAPAPPGTDVQLARLTERVELIAERLGAGDGAAAPMRPAGHTPAAPAPGEILVVWTESELPILDPTSRFWNDAPVTTVPLQPQQQAMPMLDAGTVPSVDVQAMTDGQRIAWRLTWPDASADWHLDTDRFCDAVAIQLPLKENAAYTMGDRGFPVQVVQWKAIWQKDIDEGFQDVQDLHPNYWCDLYWFAEGEFPYRVPQAFERTESLDWFIAYRAGNPMANFFRTQPVEEMVAEGFSTLTLQTQAVSVARGVRTDTGWSVVIGRPMRTSDQSDFQFAPGTRNVVAFAAWEGSAANVSGRKNHSQWIAFEVQQ
jgi:hypothetical protein